MPQLKSLDVQRSIRLTDEALQSIADFPQLTDLVLVENLFTNQGLAHLAKLPQLEELDVSECSQLDDEGLDHLAGIKSLTRLNLWRVQVGVAGVAHLTGLPICAAFSRIKNYGRRNDHLPQHLS